MVVLTDMPHVINLGNSIIGVSILAMPYCFKQCGIFLGVLLVVLSNLFTRATCHLLLRSSMIAKRRNYEFLAYHTFGLVGKLAVEISMIGFLIGTGIAFFVIIGDLGPPIVSGLMGIENDDFLRSFLMIFLGLVVILPLCMLRDLGSLSSFNAMSMLFYVIFVLKIIFESLPMVTTKQWMLYADFWRPAGVLQCLPIIAMSLSCQFQLFVLYDHMGDPNPKRMNSIVGSAVNLCSLVYITVGVFGYIAFCITGPSGNILLNLQPGFVTECIKVFFVLAVAISFPLIVFPMRESINTLLYKKAISHDHMVAKAVLPDKRFKAITITIVTICLAVGILIPKVETILGLTGSTMGNVINYIIPALIFISLVPKQTNEKSLAQIVLLLGIAVLILSTYINLQAISFSSAAVQQFENPKPKPVVPLEENFLEKREVEQQEVAVENDAVDLKNDEAAKKADDDKHMDGDDVIKDSEENGKKDDDDDKIKEEKPPDEESPLEEKAKRQEPVIPEAPIDNAEAGPILDKENNVGKEDKVEKAPNESEKLDEVKDTNTNDKKSDQDHRQDEKKSVQPHETRGDVEETAEKDEAKPVKKREEKSSEEGEQKLRKKDSKSKLLEDTDKKEETKSEKRLEEVEKKQEKLIEFLEGHQQEQNKLIQEQKELIEELKKHNVEHDIKEAEENLVKVQEQARQMQQQDLIRDQQQVFQQQSGMQNPQVVPQQQQQQQPVFVQLPPQHQQPIAVQQQPNVVQHQQQPIVVQSNVLQQQIGDQGQYEIHQQQQQQPVLQQQQLPLLQQQHQQQQEPVNRQQPQQQPDRQDQLYVQQPVLSQNQQQQQQVIHQGQQYVQQPIIPHQQQQQQEAIFQQPILQEQRQNPIGHEHVNLQQQPNVQAQGSIIAEQPVDQQQQQQQQYYKNQPNIKESQLHGGQKDIIQPHKQDIYQKHVSLDVHQQSHNIERRQVENSVQEINKALARTEHGKSVNVQNDFVDVNLNKRTPEEIAQEKLRPDLGIGH